MKLTNPPYYNFKKTYCLFAVTFVLHAIEIYLLIKL